MFDTMTITKIVGGFCGALLVFLLGAWLAESIFHPHVAYHDGERVQGFIIEVAEEETGPVEEVSEEELIAQFQEAFAAADPAAGEREFRPCAACHSLVAGENRTGPYLAGVVGREVDTAQGFNYSGALERVVDVWTPEHLNFFIENPSGYTPGTSMNFRGIRDLQARANLIAYLATIQ